jgi:hypothetical protein
MDAFFLTELSVKRGGEPEAPSGLEPLYEALQASA